jgi:gag-polypeptide of LTR copia-type
MKGLSTAKDMWNTIKDNAMSKSMLYQLDAEDQLSSIKLVDNNDPKTHLNELKAHF